MSNGLLLWVDDEIELLKAHIIFLEKKGYEVVTVSNGADAIEQCRTQTFDLVLLDEQMPGLSGLETLQKMKEIQSDIADIKKEYPPQRDCYRSYTNRLSAGIPTACNANKRLPRLQRLGRGLQTIGEMGIGT